MRIDRIVIGMDFSAAALGAARWAAKHLAPRAELALANVIELPQRPTFLAAIDLPRDQRDPAERARLRLEELARSLSPSRVRVVVRFGRPHEELAALAIEERAALLVVGPRGDRESPSHFLGTTADRLVRTSSVPVLVATGVGSAAPHRILAAVDDADVTPQLLAWCRHLAQAFDASVLAVHVVSDAAMSFVMSLAAATADSPQAEASHVGETMRSEAKRWLEQLVESEIGRARAAVAVTFGRPGEAVLSIAESTEAELVVIGRRGSGQVAPALLGSTVGTVLHGARCPVLVVTEGAQGGAEETATHAENRELALLG